MSIWRSTSLGGNTVISSRVTCAASNALFRDCAYRSDVLVAEAAPPPTNVMGRFRRRRRVTPVGVRPAGALRALR